jgi:hypothetical protein
MEEMNTAELLGRIDERTKNTAEAVHSVDLKIDSFTTRLAVVESSVESLQPVKRVVYGAVGFILFAVLSALIALILIRSN